jgi:hypothetical protein
MVLDIDQLHCRDLAHALRACCTVETPTTSSKRYRGRANHRTPLVGPARHLEVGQYQRPLVLKTMNEYLDENRTISIKSKNNSMRLYDGDALTIDSSGCGGSLSKSRGI